MQTTANVFANGQIVTPLTAHDTANLAWNEHAMFKGVFLKHLLTSRETNGLLSCHLVKVNPGAILDTHTHVGQLETHQVLGGNGQGVVAGQTVSYMPGLVSLIPADAPHRVTAGDEGLLLLATFAPALI